MDIGDLIKKAHECHISGDVKRAEEIYRKILSIQPQNASICNDLGNLLRESNRIDEAIQYYKKAIELSKDCTGALFNLAETYHEIGYLENAKEYYDKLIKLNPDFIAAHYNIANICDNQGNLDKALYHYENVIKLDPHHFDAYNNIGCILQEKGHYADSIKYFEKAISLNPNFADAYNNLGISFAGMGHTENAIYCYLRAIRIKGDFAQAYNNLGILLQKKGDKVWALSCYKKTLELNPNNPTAFNNMGIILHEQGQLEEAYTCFKKAIYLNPTYENAYCNLANVLFEQRKFEEAYLFLKQALDKRPNYVEAFNNRLFYLNFSIETPHPLYLEHLQFAKRFEETFKNKIFTHNNSRIQNRKLKIGYVSPDFRSHSVSYFIKGIISAHSRECFEVFCYSNVLIPDEMTFYFKTRCDHWRDIVGISDEKASELIRADGIDILVDLAGHTAGNRLLLFARKPAPIQITWIGYPCTTGLHSIDYKIVDDYTDPPKATEKYYSEKLIRMPECFLCYQPEVDSPEVRDLPALNTGYITFGSFNNFAKISSNILLLWIEILRRLPKACLIIKAKSLSDTVTREEFLKRFNEEGIDSGRIKLLRWEPTIRRHLELYNSIDIALDTYPYNGTTTTCEALWMGVPVITLAGRTHASRVGVSLLSNVGLQGLIAKTKEEYIEIAIDLAKDLNKLRLIRRELRHMMQSSPLTDTKRFTKNLEDSYRDIWVRWCTDKAR